MLDSGVKIVVLGSDDRVVESAVECEQAAFSRERICCSFPRGALFSGMMQWMRRWSLELSASSHSFAALSKEGKVTAFVLCERFPPPEPYVDKETDPQLSAPVVEVLDVLERELVGLTTGNLPDLNPEHHVRHSDAALRSRIKEATSGGTLQTLHVAQIGCLQSPESAGLVKATLKHALRDARDRGMKIAFAETSGPQSTALCRSTGAQIVLTSFLNLFSSHSFIRDIPECEDRNPDVAMFPKGKVPPVIRLVVWELNENLEL